MDCGDPTSNVTNMNHEFQSGSAPSPSIYQKTSTLRCRAGYRFADGFSSKVITCQANGAWSAFTACQGMLLFKLFLSYRKIKKVIIFI